MSMNPESRKRAVERIACKYWNECCIDAIEAQDLAEKALDALLAAGFHVAEWRKVGEATANSCPLLTHSKSGYWVADTVGALVECFNREADTSRIMDLPEPPKTEGEG